MKSRSSRIFLVAAVVILAALVVIYKSRSTNSFPRAETSHHGPVVFPKVPPRAVSLPPVSAPVSTAAPTAAPALSETSSDRARRVKQARYLLPTDRYLMSAGLKLTDDQQRRLQAVKDALKPRQDAALSDIWTQIDDLNKQKTDLYSGASPEVQQTPDFQDQANLIADRLQFDKDQENKIAAQFDQDYQVQVLALLTPEQQTSYAQAVGAMIHNFTPAAPQR